MSRLRYALELPRRAVLAGLLLASGASLGIASAPAGAVTARWRSRLALSAVSGWGCQYQNVDLVAIARSDLDLIVIDPCLDDDQRRLVTASDCVSIKRRPEGSRRLVLAYLSVGEADTKRWYWPAAWRENVPDWAGAENENWPGARSVQYWRAEWRELIYAGSGSILDRILDAGFDGVFLDRVDAYGDWGSTPAMLDAMAETVAAIGRKARSRNPDFILMVQNAEHVLDRKILIDAIDAHSKESLLTGLSAPDTLNAPEDVEWSLGHLRPLQRKGIPTFAIEYIAREELKGDIRRRLVELGFRPFFGNRGLDRLPVQLAVSAH